MSRFDDQILSSLYRKWNTLPAGDSLVLSWLDELRPDVTEEGTDGLQSQCSRGAFAVGVAGHLGWGQQRLSHCSSWLWSVVKLLEFSVKKFEM